MVSVMSTLRGLGVGPSTQDITDGSPQGSPLAGQQAASATNHAELSSQQQDAALLLHQLIATLGSTKLEHSTRHSTPGNGAGIDAVLLGAQQMGMPNSIAAQRRRAASTCGSMAQPAPGAAYQAQAGAAYDNNFSLAGWLNNGGDVASLAALMPSLAQQAVTAPVRQSSSPLTVHSDPSVLSSLDINGISGQPPASSVTSLYVKNLPQEAGELQLYHIFSPYGALHSCKLKTDPATGLCTGVAFINFFEESAALRALAAVNASPPLVGGRKLNVTLQEPRAERAARKLQHHHIPMLSSGPKWPGAAGGGAPGLPMSRPMSLLSNQSGGGGMQSFISMPGSFSTNGGGGGIMGNAHHAGTIMHLDHLGM